MTKTQEKEGFFYKPPIPYVVTSSEDNVQSKDKSVSPELLSLIKAAAKSLDAFASLWDSIKKKAQDEGFSEAEMQDILRPMLRERMGLSRDRVYYLFHKEAKKEYQRQRYHGGRNNLEFPDKKDIEQSTTTEDELPPEMQAIAAKQVQRDIVVEEGPPFRVAIVEKDLRAARDLVMRELTKLKGGGWKVIEVRTRRIT